MKLITFSDLHGETNMVHKLADKISGVDIVLLSGDITHFGRETETERIINTIKQYNENILAVPGNCDYPEVNQYLVAENLSLDCRTKIIDKVFFAGVGGSLPCPGKTPNEYSEEDFSLFLNEISEEKPANLPFVLLMHQPPYNTKVDKLPNGGHVGSFSIRKFIETFQPNICFCGHIHESVAKDTLGNTIVVNPGSLGMAGYVETELTGNNIIIEIRNYFG